jgi:hypothetical protein
LRTQYQCDVMVPMAYNKLLIHAGIVCRVCVYVAWLMCDSLRQSQLAKGPNCRHDHNSIQFKYTMCNWSQLCFFLSYFMFQLSSTHFQEGRLKQLGVELLAQVLNLTAPGEIRTRNGANAPTTYPMYILHFNGTQSPVTCHLHVHKLVDAVEQSWRSTCTRNVLFHYIRYSTIWTPKAIHYVNLNI